MLKNISGFDYLVVIALLVALYYLIIILLFYSNELKEILNGKRKLNFKPSPEHIEFLEQDYLQDNAGNKGNEAQLIHKPFVETSDETFEEVEQLITGLQFLIASNADEKIGKAEFVSRISSLLRLHPDLKNSLFIPVINELIIAECEKYNYVLLTEEEILELW
ncbi:hypothetical protein [Pedobacter sp. WC2423]|uniref:hypothetical protein n=1 Tax=Pedobacter sp. WC2423 TaxID=3234142 RepID=UPI00346528B2